MARVLRSCWCQRLLTIHHCQLVIWMDPPVLSFRTQLCSKSQVCQYCILPTDSQEDLQKDMNFVQAPLCIQMIRKQTVEQESSSLTPKYFVNTCSDHPSKPVRKEYAHHAPISFNLRSAGQVPRGTLKPHSSIFWYPATPILRLMSAVMWNGMFMASLTSLDSYSHKIL